MTVPAAPAIALLGERRWSREIVLGSLVTAVVASLLLVGGPPPGDAPAHLYRTLLVRHGVLFWDNFWYAGQYPLASYSVLYYLPAAAVGNLPLVFAAALVSTALFTSITLREWGAAALWPSRVFGVLAAAPLFTGLYAYSLGFMTMLAAVRALQARRTWLAIVLAGLTVGFSPLAFAFLCLILAAVWISRRRISKRVVAVGVGLAAIAAVELVTLALFATPGSYPFHAVNFAGVLSVSALGHRACPPGTRRHADRGVLRTLGGGQRCGLPGALAGRRQLDAPRRVRLPGDAAGGEPGRFPAATPRDARARRRVRIQRRSVSAADPVPARRPTGPRRVLAASGRIPSPPFGAELPGGGRADGCPLGVVLAARIRRRPRAWLVQATRRRRQPDAIPHPSRRARVSALAPHERRQVRSAAGDVARRGRRSARGAHHPLGRKRPRPRLHQPRPGASTSCPTRRRS